jgi:hydrogenase maturation factor
MCLAIPVKIKKINGFEAEVENIPLAPFDKGERKKNQKIDITMMPELKKGDWILTNGILAVKKINVKEAEEFFNLIK